MWNGIVNGPLPLKKKITKEIGMNTMRLDFITMITKKPTSDCTFVD